MKKEIKLQSTNNKDMLHVYIWEPDEDIKGIVQISHGMIEHIDRYDEFARFLNDAGYLCIGNDHIGHGRTASNSEALGYFGEGTSAMVVNDLYEVTKYAKSTYGEKIPYIMFGHSMGSFMARRYLMEYGDNLTAAIISGTGYTPYPVLTVGNIIVAIVKLFKGEHHRSAFMEKNAFGSYNKRIPNAATTHDWLTKDKEIVERYLSDELCTFSFTVNGYETLFDVLGFIQSKENIARIPKDLPIFMISGAEDPVGGYGKGVKRVYEGLKKAGIKNISLKLYEEDRHELTNELDRKQVFEDIKSYLATLE